MNRMHNPAHPGAVLREYLGEMSVTDAATALGITRTALSRILNEKAGISADMALRLDPHSELAPNVGWYAISV